MDVSPALACSSAAPLPKLEGVPSQGATNVPTDVVPYYLIPSGLYYGAPEVPGDFTLVSNAGDAVPLRERAVAQGFELFPARPLLPNTTYVLTATWTLSPGYTLPQGGPVVDSVEFTTGSGPLAAPPAAPVVEIWHYYRPRPRSSCDGSPFGTCIPTSDPTLFVATVRMNELGELEPESISQGGWFTSGSTQPSGRGCLQLRTRALNGTYSEPTQVCTSDFVGAITIEGDAAVRPAFCGPGASRPSGVNIGPSDAAVPEDRSDAAAARWDSAVPPGAVSSQPHDAATAADGAASSIDGGLERSDLVTQASSRTGQPSAAAQGCSAAAASPRDLSGLALLLAMLAPLLAARRRRS